MTIELMDLNPLPANLAGQAFTLVAVPGPAGPVRYKALLPAGGGTGVGLNLRGNWTPNTVYSLGDLVTYQGSSYAASGTFTSATSFNAANWQLIASADEAPGLGLTLRGAWAANTAYSPGDLVTYQGSSYAALSAFTSATSFNASNWQLIASGGRDGVGGIAPDGQTITTNSAGKAVVVGKSAPALDALALAADTPLVGADSAGNVKRTNPADLLTWIGQQVPDLSASPLGGTAIQTDLVLGFRNGSPVLLPGLNPAPVPVSAAGQLTVVNGDTLIAAVNPAVVWSTAPNFSTQTKAFGASSLAGGVGTLGFSLLPNGNSGPADQATANYGFFIQSSTSSFTGTSDFRRITDSNGTTIGIRRTGTTLSIAYDGTVTNTGFVIGDGALHHVRVNIAAANNGNNYISCYLDGADASKVAVGYDDHLYLRTGSAQLAIDSTQLAVGDIVDEEVIRRTDGNLGAPTAEVVRNTDTMVILHWNGDSANVAADPANVTVSDKADQVTIIGGRDTPLAAPMLKVITPTLALPTDGSPFAPQINAWIADCLNRGRSHGRLREGWTKSFEDVRIPSGFTLEGMGRLSDGGDNNWGGGVKIQIERNVGKAAISMIGAGNSNGTTANYVYKPGLINVCAMGIMDINFAMADYRPALIEMINVYEPYIERVSGGNDFFCFMRRKSVWDAVTHNVKVNSGGLCDVTADPSSAAVLKYTGRRAAMASEMTRFRKDANGNLVAGASLGVPALDLWSDDPGGQAVTNNDRFYTVHVESNAEGGVPLMVHGANTGYVQFFGSKLENTEGATPQIVLDGTTNFYYQGQLYAAATGFPYSQIGGVPQGASWAQYPISAALVLSAGSYNPTIIAGGGYSNGGSAGSPDALFRFFGGSNPAVSFGCDDGLNRLTQARIILDGVEKVNPYRLNVAAADYVPGSGGVPTLLTKNGCSLDPALTTVVVGGKTVVCMPWTAG